MRKLALVLLVFLSLLAAREASARQATGVRLRATPATVVPTHISRQLEARPRSSSGAAVPGTSSSATSLQPLTLNCGSDGVPTIENTLVLFPTDAAGTIYAPQADTDSLDLKGVSFAVFDGGASYPGTIAIDFYSAIDAYNFAFVAGVDVPILSSPGFSGADYQVDLTPYDIRTGNELLVLLSDPNATLSASIIPAGDSSASCYDGGNACSVLLDGTSGQLYLYGTSDPESCPSAVDNILLFDLVLEVQIDTGVPVDAPSFGALKARYSH